MLLDKSKHAILQLFMPVLHRIRMPPVALQLISPVELPDPFLHDGRMRIPEHGELAEIAKVEFILFLPEGLFRPGLTPMDGSEGLSLSAKEYIHGILRRNTACPVVFTDEFSYWQRYNSYVDNLALV